MSALIRRQVRSALAPLRAIARAFAILALSALAVVAPRDARASSPRPRVVSINPCVDAVLVRVAEPEQILAMSHYSHDPQATSIPLEVARRFKVTSATAEEVVALAPDVVMSGPHVSPATIFALERMHIRIEKFSVAESVAESEAQIQRIAAAVGAPERGRALIAAIQRAIDDARSQRADRFSAVIWQGGGMVPGKGTLADELLRRTGFRNLSEFYGLAKWDVLPLEYLIAHPPDVVLSVGTGNIERDRMLDHPAIQKLGERVAFRRYPFRLLSCGGPTIIEAVARLSEVRREMETQR